MNLEKEYQETERITCLSGGLAAMDKQLPAWETARHSARPSHPVARAFDLVLDAAAVLAAALLVAMTLIITWSVISRRWLGDPWSWNLEFSEYALLAVSFLGAAWTLRRGAHVQVDLLVNVLPPRLQHALYRLNQLLGLVVCATLAWYSAQGTADTLREGQMLIKALTVPKWATMLVIPVGLVLLALQFARNLLAGPERPTSAMPPVV
jgi:C4-dicarboxylate transporter DctQ subunit